MPRQVLVALPVLVVLALVVLAQLVGTTQALLAVVLAVLVVLLAALVLQLVGTTQVLPVLELVGAERMLRDQVETARTEVALLVGTLQTEVVQVLDVSVEVVLPAVVPVLGVPVGVVRDYRVLVGVSGVVLLGSSQAEMCIRASRVQVLVPSARRRR